MRLLIADDQQSLNAILVKQFKKEGYSVDSCFDGEEVFNYLAGVTYDAIILDVMMPKMDGFEVLKRIRQKNISTPVLFLTAKCDIDDRVNGLDIGANDYVVKPFEFKELSARVRAMIRNSKGSVTNDFRLADLSIDFKSHIVKRGGKIINLSSKEYAILECLARNAGTVLSRRKIEDSAWNYDYSGGTNVIDVYIRYLRKKIDDGFSDKLIHTVRGAGYILREDK